MVPLRYNVRSILERRTTSLMTVLGVGLVAMMFVLLFGFIGGLKQTLINTGGPQNWIVMSRGVTNENMSNVTHEQVEILRARPEVLTASGVGLVSPEIVGGVSIGRDKRVKQFVTLRGVDPIAFQTHRNMKLVAGRWPIRGQGEWVIGKAVAARAPYMTIGSKFHFGRRNWTIVGIFSDANSSRESEVWTDFNDLKTDAKARTMDTNAVHVILKPGMEDAFNATLKNDGRLSLQAMTEKQYYALQARLVDQLQALGLIVVLALALGATFGGMNTMYSAVARRQREIGVMRVLGFSRFAILLSFVLESAFIAFIGGCVGLMLAVALAQTTGLDNRLLSVGSTFFTYRLDAAAVTSAIIVATIIGVAGGLMPAWRASRVRIIESLREA
ncbi:MAG TPA: ABC transporter permease [Candidatus Binataceae bacterium]|nr:ABC transporter permease [Candidatus Binataceae bacterium]